VNHGLPAGSARVPQRAHAAKITAKATLLSPFSPTPTQSSIGVLTSCNSECSLVVISLYRHRYRLNPSLLNLLAYFGFPQIQHIGIYRVQATRPAWVERDQA
jgi:hypothetical protein